MMSEWLSYRLSDFVMISAQVHDRQLELHNEYYFGYQILAVALGALIVWLISWRPDPGNRIIPPLLGLIWIWVGWSFLWQRYGDLHLAAPYAASAFAVQGSAFIATLLFPKGLAVRLPDRIMRTPATALLTFALVLYPLLAPITGRKAITAEFFALMPDPTAIGALAVLAVSQNPIRWLLMVIPAMWCAVSATTLWVLDLPQFWIVAVTPALAFAIAVPSHR